MVVSSRIAHMLVSKLVTLPVPTYHQVCRHASRDASGWRSQRSHDSKRRQQEDTEDDMDAMEAKLESIISEERRRRKAVKFHKIRRQINKPGAPERKLSWDAIEQIRYLKQESPEEWTLQKLAEGFSVSPDIISRVLRSNFTPPTKRKLQQDSKVLPSIGQLSLGDGNAGQSKPPLPKSEAPAMLSSGTAGALMALSNRALTVREVETGLMPSGGNVPSVSRLTSLPSTDRNVTDISQKLPDARQKTPETEVKDNIELEEEWNGVILTEEELEQIAETLQEKPSPVEQKGREFFDSEGNFLYRI